MKLSISDFLKMLHPEDVVETVEEMYVEEEFEGLNHLG